MRMIRQGMTACKFRVQADGFAAPDGQRFALTTRRLDNAARYPQLHSPSNNEGILCLTGMKENCRVYFNFNDPHNSDSRRTLKLGKAGPQPYGQKLDFVCRLETSS